jgi:hypothetical protein
MTSTQAKCEITARSNDACAPMDGNLEPTKAQASVLFSHSDTGVQL